MRISRGVLTGLKPWPLVLVAVLCFGCLPNVVPVVPTPEPTPVVPDGSKVKGDLFLVVVEETGERTPATAEVLQGSSEFWQGLKARGVVYRWYDDDSDDAAEYAKAVSHRPGWIVFDKNGKALFRGPLPKSTAEIDKFLKGLGK